MLPVCSAEGYVRAHETGRPSRLDRDRAVRHAAGACRVAAAGRRQRGRLQRPDQLAQRSRLRRRVELLVVRALDAAQPGRRRHAPARHRHAPRPRVGQDAGRSARAGRRHRLGHRLERRRADQPAVSEPGRAAAADGLPRLRRHQVRRQRRRQVQRRGLHDHHRPHAAGDGHGVRPARQRQERQRRHRSRGSRSSRSPTARTTTATATSTTSAAGTSSTTTTTRSTTRASATAPARPRTACPSPRTCAAASAPAPTARR